MKPASSVVRQLSVPRNVRNAGSSCTSLRGFPPLGPPSSMLSSMSIRPGQQRDVAEVDLGRVARQLGGVHRRDAFAFDDDRPPATAPRPRRCRPTGPRAGRSVSAHGSGSISEVEVRGAGIGNVRLAPRFHRERHHHERVEQLQQVARRLRACRRAGTSRSTRSPLRRGERTRRRTPASRPSSSPCAARTAPVRWPGTTSRANGSSSEKALGRSASVIAPPPRARACSRRSSRRPPCAGGGRGSPGR